MVKEIFEKELAKKGYVKGRYIRMSWKSENNGYEKISNGLVRLFSDKVVACKNGNEIVRMRITKNKNHKVKVSYYYNGVEIDRNEYLNGGNKEYEINDWFSKNINDIIMVY